MESVKSSSSACLLAGMQQCAFLSFSQVAGILLYFLAHNLFCVGQDLFLSSVFLRSIADLLNKAVLCVAFSMFVVR